MEPFKLNFRLSDHRVICCFTIGKIRCKKLFWKKLAERTYLQGMFNKVKFMYLTRCPIFHSIFWPAEFPQQWYILNFSNNRHRLCSCDFLLQQFHLVSCCSRSAQESPVVGPVSHKIRNKSLGWLIFCLSDMLIRPKREQSLAIPLPSITRMPLVCSVKISSPFLSSSRRVGWVR